MPNGQPYKPRDKYRPRNWAMPPMRLRWLFWREKNKWDAVWRSFGWK